VDEDSELFKLTEIVAEAPSESQILKKAIEWEDSTENYGSLDLTSFK